MVARSSVALSGLARRAIFSSQSLTVTDLSFLEKYSHLILDRGVEGFING